jgi:hypothetical protein
MNSKKYVYKPDQAADFASFFFQEKDSLKSQKPFYIAQKIKNAEKNQPNVPISKFTFDFEDKKDKMDLDTIED